LLSVGGSNGNRLAGGNRSTSAKTSLGQHAVSAVKGSIADYDAYREQANAATKKGIDEAQAPDAVVNTITKLIRCQ
jgi:hypothetical protein